VARVNDDDSGRSRMPPDDPDKCRAERLHPVSAVLALVV
jgi:hypothetical protein